MCEKFVFLKEIDYLIMGLLWLFLVHLMSLAPFSSIDPVQPFDLAPFLLLVYWNLSLLSNGKYCWSCLNFQIRAALSLTYIYVDLVPWIEAFWSLHQVIEISLFC